MQCHRGEMKHWEQDERGLTFRGRQDAEAQSVGGCREAIRRINVAILRFNKPQICFKFT